MLFNSIDFAIFLPIVFTLYWLIKNIKFQNLLIVAASYVFYGWWDWRFLSLILFSTLVDYIVGVKLSKTENKWLFDKISEKKFKIISKKVNHFNKIVKISISSCSILR